MELSERYIQKFESEGFTSVYEWQDKVGTVYNEHAHQGKVSIFVTDGSITFDFEGEKREVKAGERFDVPVGAHHSAVVGPQGWIAIIAEEIAGDSWMVASTTSKAPTEAGAFFFGTKSTEPSSKLLFLPTQERRMVRALTTLGP